MALTAPQGGFITLLKNKNFLRLWLAQLISLTILFASNYGLLVLIEEVTGSTTLIGRRAPQVPGRIYPRLYQHSGPNRHPGTDTRLDQRACPGLTTRVVQCLCHPRHPVYRSFCRPVRSRSSDLFYINMRTGLRAVGHLL